MGDVLLISWIVKLITNALTCREGCSYACRTFTFPEIPFVPNRTMSRETIIKWNGLIGRLTDSASYVIERNEL